jgi:uncharacterized protein YcnI
MRHRSCRRAAAVVAAAFLTPLIVAAPAWAHAAISPPVAVTGVLQQLTLTVPTEKEGATTTEIELTVPNGIGIDSFEAAPGWTRKMSATGSGEAAIVNTVTWSGGSVPTGEDAAFHFVASITGGAKTYTFTVRQTYSDGSVVDWNGSESSDSPSPTIVAVSSLGGGGSSSTLAIVALVVGAIGVLVASVALLGGRRSLT